MAWMVWDCDRGVRDRNESLWQCPALLGKLGVHSRTLPFPSGRNHGEIPWTVLFALNCAALGGGDTGKVTLFFFLTPTSAHSYSPLQNGTRTPLETWTSTDLLIHQGRPKFRFCRHSRTLAERAQERFTVSYSSHSWCQSPSTYHLTFHGWHFSWVPQFPQRHFCLWTDGEFFLLKEGQDKGWLV